MIRNSVVLHSKELLYWSGFSRETEPVGCVYTAGPQIMFCSMPTLMRKIIDVQPGSLHVIFRSRWVFSGTVVSSHILKTCM